MKGKKIQEHDYRNLIIDSTKPIEYLDKFPNGQIFTWLANEIKNGKRSLKYNSVDFIVIKLLNRKEELINYQKLDYINLYVIGTFRSEFIPTLKVAEALAEFYLEMRILPNIYTMTKKEFIENSNKSISRIKNGVLIYDREGNLH